MFETLELLGERVVSGAADFENIFSKEREERRGQALGRDLHEDHQIPRLQHFLEHAAGGEELLDGQRAVAVQRLAEAAAQFQFVVAQRGRDGHGGPDFHGLERDFLMTTIRREAVELADGDAFPVRKTRGQRGRGEFGILRGAVVEDGLHLVRGNGKRDGRGGAQEARMRAGKFRRLFGKARLERVGIGERERLQQREHFGDAVERTRNFERITEITRGRGPRELEQTARGGGKRGQRLSAVERVAVRRVATEAQRDAEGRGVLRERVGEGSKAERLHENRVVHEEEDLFRARKEAQRVGAEVGFADEFHAAMFAPHLLVGGREFGSRGGEENFHRDVRRVGAVHRERAERGVELQRAVLAEDQRGEGAAANFWRGGLRARLRGNPGIIGCFVVGFGDGQFAIGDEIAGGELVVEAFVLETEEEAREQFVEELADETGVLAVQMAVLLPRPRDARGLLREQAERAAVGRDAGDVEAEFRAEVLVPFRRVAAVKVKRELMQTRHERGGEEEASTGADEARHLAQRGDRLGYVLEDFGADDNVE